MFTFTPVQVLSVVNIAPGSGGAARRVVQNARTAAKAIHIHFLFAFI
jgi:hypothetical protein